MWWSLSLLQCLIVGGVYEGAYLSIGTCGSDKYPSDFIIHPDDNAGGIYFAGTDLHVCRLSQALWH
jgi:hypothetical protein